MVDVWVWHLGSLRSDNLFFHSYFLQIHNEEDGSGVQAGAEPSAGLGGCSAEGQPTWANSLVGRIFWDFLREKYWTDQVAQKIQKKLSKIKVRLCVMMRICSFIGFILNNDMFTFFLHILTHTRHAWSIC